MYIKRKQFEKLLLCVMDLLSIALSLYAAFLLRFHNLQNLPDMIHYPDQLPRLILIYMGMVLFGNIYKEGSLVNRGPFDEITGVVRENLVLSAIWVLILFLRHSAGDMSRLVFGYFAVIDILLMFVTHQLLKRSLKSSYASERNLKYLLLITDAEKADTLLKSIQGDEFQEYSVAGLCIADRRMTGETISRVKVEADRDSLMDWLTHNPVDEVLFAFADSLALSELREYVSDIEMMGIVVNVNIEEFDLLRSGKKSLNHVGTLSTVSFARNDMGLRGQILKRLLDITGSLVGMVILILVTVVLAPLIRLDSPGPVFFSQKRVGRNGRIFKLYKFRSMYQDAEARKQELMQQNEMNGLMFKMENDPRITRIGRFIRKTSIDEFPQFWNVLKGDMSLVGTRPPTIDEYEQYDAKHKSRLSMTPGITGMWQVSGRSDITDFEEVVRLDMEYIDNWSILLDIKILIKTVMVVFQKKGSR